MKTALLGCVVAGRSAMGGVIASAVVMAPLSLAVAQDIALPPPTGTEAPQPDPAGPNPAELADLREFALSSCAADPLLCLPTIERAYDQFAAVVVQLEAAQLVKRDAVILTEELNAEIADLTERYRTLSQEQEAFIGRETALLNEIDTINSRGDQLAALENALFDSGETLSERDGRLLELTAQLASATAARDALSIDLANANDYNLLLEDELASLGDTVSERTTTTQIADEILADREAAINALENRLIDRNQKLLSLNDQIVSLQTANDATRNAKTAAEQRAAAAQAELEDMSGELSTLQSEIDRIETEKATTLDALQRVNDDLKAALDGVKATLPLVQTSLQSTQQQNDLLRDDLARTQRELARARADTAEDLALQQERDALLKKQNSLLMTQASLQQSRDALAQERDALNAELATDSLYASATRDLLVGLLGNRREITPSILRDVQDFGESPQNYVYNNLVAGWLRNRTLGNLQPILRDGDLGARGVFATQEILDLQRAMNGWLEERGENTATLGLPFQRQGCDVRLCEDGIVGKRTKQLAEIIYAREPEFFVGAGPIR